MIRITSAQVTPELRNLFRQDEPQVRRCFAVLDGVNHHGKIICDKPTNPTWAIVQEEYDGSIYLGGSVDASILASVFEVLRQEGEVLVGLWLDDPRQKLLPPSPDYDGRTLEFYNRPLGKGLETYLHPLPSGCQIHRINRDLVMQTEWGPDDVRRAGSIEAWEKQVFGYCLMRGNEMLSEASVGLPAIGLYEPGIFTQVAHRGNGYATIAVAYLIQEIESLGGQTYWNCAKQNLASAAVARKLGYQIEKEYRCMVWSKLD